MKRLLFTFITFFCVICLHAQELQVKTFKELMSDLSARTYRRFDMNDEPCALIKIEYPHDGATFEGMVVGDWEFKKNEYWVYLSKGAKRVKVHIPGYTTVTIEFSEFGINQVEANTTYVVEFKFPSKLKSSFYVEAGYVIGGTMGPEVSLGAYLGGFNIEFNAYVPMGASETIYWQSDTQYPQEFTYKPSIAFGGRIGYGIMAGKKFRITPQVGMMYMGLKETAVGGSTLAPAKGANCASLTLDCKLQYMIAKNFGISLTPEYDLALAKSKGFIALSDVSDKIKKWNNGISVKVAVNLEF